MSIDEVPVAHTPPGGYGDAFPAPILFGGAEPTYVGFTARLPRVEDPDQRS